MRLTTSLRDVLRTTTDHWRALDEMEIRTVQDLLLYLPRAHEDLSAMRTVSQSPLGEKVTLRGTVDGVKLVRIRGGRQLVQARFTDAEGSRIDLVWFNQPHVKRMLADGTEIAITGKLSEQGRRLSMPSPQFELAGDGPLLHAGKIVAIYPQHDRITAKWLREKLALVAEAIDLLPETLPPEVLNEEDLPGRSAAVRALHFPESPEAVERAKRRMTFEEMYLLQRAALERRQAWQQAGRAGLRVPMDVELIRTFFASLHFTPTASQKIAIYEILRDLERDVPMSRLLEGDVGSGKTLVAVAVMATVVRAGGQCALMVPTEVLAKQHAETIGRLLVGFHAFLEGERKDVAFPMLRLALLTGSTPGAEARERKQALAAGTLDIAIGTHALIEDDVQFKDLRLVIVDEQHRFGVLQRRRLTTKGNPHFLSMTATPIPRTLALTAYGDHDLSVLLEKPGNRLPIVTKVVGPNDRKTVELFIDREIGTGRQAFVICPLIEGSEADEMLDVRNVEQEVARLSAAFPRRKIGKLHGRMTPAEKERTMRAFKERAFDVLVSTSVIEVGIDVPNSTIIVIEGAERFGLAQLHQFRGRIGRGEHRSHCFLFTTTPEQARSVRLRAMEKYDSGFELAEVDLKLRGPGEIFGTRQSGIPELRFGSLLNPALIVRARQAAERALGIAAGSPPV